MTDYGKAAFRGAVDLSTLGKPKEQAPTQQALGSAADGPIRVPSLVVEVDQSLLVAYVKISDSLPVLVDFYTQRSQSSLTLSAKLATDVINRAGQVVLLRIDGDANPQLLQAFQITQLPAVAAMIKGQPVPMFAGDQEEEVITQVIDKVVALANQNGLNGVAIADSEAVIETPMLPPRLQAAYDAIDSQDYETAVKEFQAALAEAPADEIAATGLAQAKLLLRTKNLDFEAVVEAPARELADVLQKADVLAVIGHFELAYKALLDTFELATKEDREVLRQHLLELFKTAGPNHPAAAQARIRLTNLLY